MVGKFFIGVRTTNPAINTVLVITDPLNFSVITGATSSGVTIAFDFIVTSTVAAEFYVQVLNLSDAVVRQFSLRCLANATMHLALRTPFEVPNDFKVRIINPVAITGIVQANIATDFIDLVP